MGQSCSSPNAINASLLPLGGHAPEPHGGPKLATSALGVPGRPSAAPNREGPEPPIPIHVATFSIRRRKRGGQPSPVGTIASPPPRSAGTGEGWRRWYTPGRELGKGISAIVYEAEAVAKVPGANEKQQSLFSAPNLCGANGIVPGCIPDRGRRVAVKRFKKIGSRSFHTELAALLRLGTHPNVLRLLESYEDCEGEDALVLEYCDGCTVFDAYAQVRKHGDCLPELLVARLVRQLLLALEHILSCGVEHQDIKPENMLLYGYSLQEQRAELKLADFGWATANNQTAPGGTRVAIEPPPAEGAGSLWYAPPELNPPVVEPPPGQELPVLPRPAGRSDMWSVGVVVYLMLVGHNPFNAALKQRAQKAIEHEVIRHAASGEFDKTSPRWLDLPQDAREFILAMIVVSPANRLSAAEALRHPYLVRRLARCSEAAPPEPAWRRADREDAWSQLDGFQRLAWAAVSRSVAEPELSREAVAVATRAMQTSSGQGRGSSADCAYIWHLARELSAASAPNWLADSSAWAEVLRLAFRYLDSDDDGMLSPKDIVTHLVNPSADAAAHADAWSAAHLWVSRWCHKGGSNGGLPSVSSGGLLSMNFRAALLASYRDSSSKLGDGIEELDGDGCQDNQPFADFSFQPGYSTGREEELCGWSDVWNRGGN